MKLVNSEILRIETRRSSYGAASLASSPPPTNHLSPPSPYLTSTMPRNQGTSRKGKPKKEMRSAGFGNALQRYVFYAVVNATTKWWMEKKCDTSDFENEWGSYVLLFNIFSEREYIQWRLTSLWFWRSRSIAATHIYPYGGCARSCCFFCWLN